MECVGAIDQGTQSTRFFLYAKDCSVIASHQVPVPQLYPKAGWVEQDPLAIWQSVTDAITGALQQAQQQHGEVNIRAIGITNQRETTVVWSKETGRPLHNAIVWLDGRTAAVCADMERRLGGRDALRTVTGLPISTYFSAFKLKWLIDHVQDVAAAVSNNDCMFGTVDSWLLYQLTGGANHGGVHVTDVTNASRTALMDIQTLRWHDATVANTFGFQQVILPEIRSNAEVYGVIHSEMLSELGGVPLAGCLGDQQAAMLGQRCLEHEAKNTYGTGCFMLLNTGAAPVASSHGLLTTLAYKLGADATPCYALEGAIAIAGQGISWLRDGLEILDSAKESEELAGSVPDSGGVFFVPAFGGLLAPWWAPDARGAILGLTQYATKAHVVRAMLEAICFQTRDVLEAMKKDADMEGLKCLFVDGGASQNDLLMQIQADVLQVPVRRPDHMETTSLGAALAAGIAVGFWSKEEALKDLKHASGGTLFVAQVPATVADKRYERWKLAVERSLGLAALEEDDAGDR